MAGNTALFAVEYDQDGKIVDLLTGASLDATPDEIVRQRALRLIHYEYDYPRDVIRRYVPVPPRSGVAEHTAQRRADIVVYRDADGCANNDPARYHLVGVCTAPTQPEFCRLLAPCIRGTGAQGGIWFSAAGGNDQVRYFRRFPELADELREWIGVPRHGEAWDALARRGKSDLVRPRDIKGLLRRCHNRLHGRGNDGEEEDLTMDMIRILLAKAMDEDSAHELPQFYCMPEEYASSSGMRRVAERIDHLFQQVKRANPDVFTPHERITVSPRAIADVVVELQNYHVLPALGRSEDWDLMGQAYEQYASVHLKREKGQYFTNRHVVDLLVSIIDPAPTSVVLDPAGGSGGFLTGVLRHVRNKNPTGPDSQNLFMVEISRRLVKIAKAAMIFSGGSHTGLTAGDSLGPYAAFGGTIISQTNRGVPDVILTNPPFAGVGDGRVTHKDVLRRFETGRKWLEKDGQYRPTDELATEGTPPELLFFERCIDWLAPGGHLGIVLPKSFLDTQTYRPGREIMFRDCRLKAVINCHRNTFQPHTGVRTCLIILQKNKPGETSTEYPIFMAISRKIGQDSEGAPIFRRDAANNATEEIDADLPDIAAAWREFEQGRLVPSTHVFQVQRSTIDALLRINPQLFLPHLNATLDAVQSLDGYDGWNVSTLGEAAPNIRIFKGPRFKSESIIVDEPKPGAEPYYTPSAVLQDKGEGMKLIDVGRASAKQLATIEAIRVRRGDIVVTRSGSIGRVAYITRKLDQAIVSDDLIRIRIENADLRFLVFSYLQTIYAQDQMIRNEYGAIQQHLEPEHLRNMLIPIPTDGHTYSEMARLGREMVAARENLEDLNQRSVRHVAGLIRDTLARSVTT